MQYKVLNNWLTSQSAANRSPPDTPCFPLLSSQKQAVFHGPPVNMFRFLSSFPLLMICRDSDYFSVKQDIFLCFRDARLGNRGKFQTTAKATTAVFAASFANFPLRASSHCCHSSASPGRRRAAPDRAIRESETGFATRSCQNREVRA